ncbi:unnamed protein product [Allacma fusca]|uniref:CHK kinase-like domain-containing protein n=1 Tax=Allacma fusca TaxID=39272 RepID=A0A8J2JSJ7_9HEXA|nr:unnamed protein product [Allacma fusca]
MEQIEAAMNAKYLSKILKTPVEKVTVTFGSNPGDNYMCVIYGLEAELASGEKKNLVIKAYPNQPARQQMLEMSNIFLKEFVVYDFWIPAFKKIQGSQGSIKLSVPPYLDGAAIDNTKTTEESRAEPKVDKSNEEFRLENFLLMEDIRLSGFKMANRLKGLDAHHCRLVLTELGKFHALEMMDSFKPVMESLMSASDKMVGESFGTDSDIYIHYKKFAENDTVETMRIFLEYQLYDMDNIESFLRVKTEFPANFEKGPWLTTCHGDCWVNNFLFRYNEDGSKPEEVCLLDFQLMREACPTTDLAYFIYTSVDGPTRTKHLKDFLKLYHDTFAATCDQLGVETMPGFNYESLLIRFRQAKIFGMMISLPLLFAVLKNPEKAEDLDTLELDNVGDIFAKGMNLNDENFLLRHRLSEVIQELYDDGVF